MQCARANFMARVVVNLGLSLFSVFKIEAREDLGKKQITCLKIIRDFDCFKMAAGSRLAFYGHVFSSLPGSSHRHLERREQPGDEVKCFL